MSIDASPDPAPRPPRRRFWQGSSEIAILLLVTTLAVACGRSGDRSVKRSALRFIDEDPGEVLVLDEIRQEEAVFAWQPSDGMPTKLTAERLGALRLVDGAVEGEAVGDQVRLIYEVDVEAAAIDAVQIGLVGLAEDRLQLFWVRQDESFDPQRSAVSTPRSHRQRRKDWYFLAVDRQSQWQGRIRRLAIEFETVPGEKVRLLGLRGTAHRYPAVAVEAIRERPWKVRLGNDLRNAWLMPRGSSIVRQVNLDEGAELRFAYGLAGEPRQEVGFRVVARTSEQEIGALFTASLDAAGSGRWHEGVVDLSPWVGEQLTLELQTTSTPLEPASAASPMLPVWGHPEIVQKASPHQRRPNIILISLDTLRADHLSLHGYRRSTSPSLDRWAAERGVVFEQAVAAAPWTLPSHVSIFTGLDALTHGVNHNSIRIGPQAMMAEILRQAGYATAAVTGGGYVHPDFGFARGFDRYEHWPDRERSEEELAVGLDRALDLVEELADRPFFLFFHTYEIHSPFLAREPYFTQFGGGEPHAIAVREDSGRPEDGFKMWKRAVFENEGEPDVAVEQVLRQLYDSAIAYTDHHLARLFARVSELGLDDDTIWIVTSDHGEALGEKGLAEHRYLYDFNLHVPLVLGLPGGLHGGRRVESQVGSVDILPTVLELAGIEVPAPVDGQSLVGLAEGRESSGSSDLWSYAAAGNHGVALRLRSRWKYLFDNTAWTSRYPREQLFDLHVDPEEEHNRLDRLGELDEVRQRVAERLATLPGMRLRFVNRGEEDFGGTLRGRMIAPRRLKAVGVPCDCFSWAGNRRLRFRLPAGEEAVLSVEGFRNVNSQLEAWVGDPSRATKVAVRRRQTENGWSLRHDGSEWQRRGAGLGEASVGIEIWWVGAMPPRSEKAAIRSLEVREQLRALGYL